MEPVCRFSNSQIICEVVAISKKRGSFILLVEAGRWLIDRSNMESYVQEKWVCYQMHLPTVSFMVKSGDSRSGILLPICLIPFSHFRYSEGKHPNYDIAVIGGGIVGAASARELILRHPSLKIALVEKEKKFAYHQSGNNSGVIHAGIYYKPGSLKAKLCVQGCNLSYKYFDEKGIKYSKCGKLIVATQRQEVPRLLDLYERGLQNGVKDMRLLDGQEIKEIEPNCRGFQAIWSPHTGIVDWGEVTRSYVKDFSECGGDTYLNFEVKKFAETENADYPVLITDLQKNTIQAKYVLTCCGLHSDTVAILTGCPEEPKIIPFRGEYLYLTPSKSNIAKANIYPVPDPRFPFLGVHLTPRIDGRVIVGPNAILAFCKEGYR